MRRVILAVTGTIAGLVALLSFKSHAPAVPVASTSGTGGGVVGVPPRPPASADSIPGSTDRERGREPARGGDRRHRQGRARPRTARCRSSWW